MTRMFGTNGVRGIVGDTMTPDFARRLGVATARWLGEGTMALGRDARASGPELQAAFAEGLHAGGIDTIDLGICPTPGIQWWIRQGDVEGGAIITASHNPPEWNGIKIIEADGTDAAPETERAIEAEYARVDEIPGGDGHSKGTADPIQGYLDAVASQVDVAAIRAAGFKAVLDEGGGAGCVTGPRLLAALGVDLVPVSCDLDPDFSDRPSEPTEENAAACIAAVKQHGAHIGMLQDGDADRCVFVTGNGDYVDGNVALAMVAGHEMARVPAAERIFATTVATSQAAVEVVEAAGGRVEWTIVGSPPVARAMRETGAPFGGEGNGGFLFQRHLLGKDGLMAMARVLEIMATTGKSLATLVSEVPQRFFVQTKIKIPEDHKQSLLAAFKEAAAVLDGIESVDDRDGVKAYLADGWVLVRPSGTEPIFRVQAEAATERDAQTILTRFQGVVEGLL